MRELDFFESQSIGGGSFLGSLLYSSMLGHAVRGCQQFGPLGVKPGAGLGAIVGIPGGIKGMAGAAAAGAALGAGLGCLVGVGYGVGQWSNSPYAANGPNGP